MFTKALLPKPDLQNLVSGVMQYNARGSVTAIMFYDKDMNPLPVEFLEAVIEAPDLTMRVVPESQEDPESQIANLAQQEEAQAMANPKQVPMPMSLKQLQRLVGQ